jgi:hypothetical protein
MKEFGVVSIKARWLPGGLDCLARADHHTGVGPLCHGIAATGGRA